MKRENDLNFVCPILRQTVFFFFFEVSRSGFDGYDVLRAGLSKKVSDAL